MAKRRAAQGSGSIRKRTVKKGGKEYTYWEARVTTGRDPGTGKQIVRSFSGKTQKEVVERMQEALVSINQGTYITPSKMTYGEWLDIWQKEYLGNVKPGTSAGYREKIRKYIKPALGNVKLSALHPHMIQTFINSLTGIAPHTVRTVYTPLHQSLKRAMQLGYISRNPTDNCILPKVQQEEICPLDDEQAAALIAAAKGTRIENLIPIALFTGMRIGEILGLTWDCVDFNNGTISINKQLSKSTSRTTAFFSSTKNGKPRTICPAKTVFDCLKAQRCKQRELQLMIGQLWHNEHNLVFTMEDGSHIIRKTHELVFFQVRDAAGLHNTRFHDLRHTYAVNSIRAGDDIKTIQGNLGHATAAFTLDRYGHLTDRMKQDSASRMEIFIKSAINL